MSSKNTPIISGINPTSSRPNSNANPIIQNPSKVTNLATQKIKQELLVGVLGQTANTLEFTANILPTNRVDPRYNNGLELVRISDGTVLSGIYLVTEVTTIYGGGKRERTISGLGHAIDGQVPTKLVDVSKGKAKGVVSEQKGNDTSNPSGSKPNTDKDKKPSQSKNTSPNNEMYYKDGKWYNV